MIKKREKVVKTIDFTREFISFVILPKATC